MWVYRRRRRLVLGDALVTTNKGESIVFGADGDADADASRVARRGGVGREEVGARARRTSSRATRVGGITFRRMRPLPPGPAMVLLVAMLAL